MTQSILKPLAISLVLFIAGAQTVLATGTLFFPPTQFPIEGAFPDKGDASAPLQGASK